MSSNPDVVCKELEEELGEEVQFGHAMLSEFHFRDWHINHGSFGSTPNAISKARDGYVAQMESRPDHWFRVVYQELMQRARHAVADYVRADVSDVVLVENTSAGVNAVLRSLDWNDGDAILVHNMAYEMTNNTAEYLRVRTGGRVSVVTAQVEVPLRGDDDFVAPIRAALEQHSSSIRLAVLDHIVSRPGVIAPIKKLVDLCHEFDVPVLVDGAHTLGQIQLDLSHLNAEYYVSNGHKWLYSPIGSAFLFVRKDMQQPHLVPTVVSARYQETDFVANFEYTGTRDYSAMLAMYDALQLRAQWGESRIHDYIHSLAHWAQEYLAELWQTQAVAPMAMTGAMVNVQLPVTDLDEARFVADKILDEDDGFLVVYAMSGLVWARVSAQVFLEKSDFTRLGRRVLELVAEHRR